MAKKKFKNISPLGDLDLPLLQRVVKAGETIEVNADQAIHLEGQSDTWEPVARAGSSNNANEGDPA